MKIEPIEIKGPIALLETLCKVSIHTILYQRGLFDKGEYEQTEIYGFKYMSLITEKYLDKINNCIISSRKCFSGDGGSVEIKIESTEYSYYYDIWTIKCIPENSETNFNSLSEFERNKMGREALVELVDRIIVHCSELEKITENVIFNWDNEKRVDATPEEKNLRKAKHLKRAQQLLNALTIARKRNLDMDQDIDNQLKLLNMQHLMSNISDINEQFEIYSDDIKLEPHNGLFFRG